MSVITIAIATRDRPESLARCLRSLAPLKDLVGEILIMDGSPQNGLPEELSSRLKDALPIPYRILKQTTEIGLTGARNALARAASYDFVLNLDDDAFLLKTEGVRCAVEMMVRDNRIAAIAFCQTDGEGKPWPFFGCQPFPNCQPGLPNHPCIVPSFIGYGYLLRRDVWLSLGGYREWLGSANEEKEVCMRLLDAGYQIVYHPDVCVAHIADPAARSPVGFLRNYVRNNILAAVCNMPWPLLFVLLPRDFLSYFRNRRAWKIDDPGGGRAVLREIIRWLPSAWRARRPVKWSTVWRWRQLRRTWPPYSPPDGS